MTSKESLDQTDQLILYLVRGLTRGVPHLLVEGGGVLTTMLAKLLLLVDVWSLQNYGMRATDFHYIRYKYGPYPLVQFDERLEGLKGLGLREIRKTTILDGKPYRIYRLTKDLQIQFTLPSEIKLMADEVLTTFTSQRLDEVLEHVYGLDCVRKASFGEQIDLELVKKEDLVTWALRAFKHDWSPPLSAEHTKVIEEAKTETSNENIGLASAMKEKQRKAFTLKQGS